MRVTQGMLAHNFLNNLHQTMGRMQKQQQQLATNKRITRLSDDPVGAMNSLTVRSKLGKITQHERNIDDAKAWLGHTETAVLELNDVVKSIYEKLVQASTGTNAPQQKEAIAMEIKELRDHIVQLGNSTYGDKHLFGGYQVTSRPFAYENGVLEYQGQDLATLDEGSMTPQKISYEVGVGLTMDVSISGPEFLGSGDDHLVKLIDETIDLLNADASIEQINEYIPRLQAHEDRNLAVATQIGGKINRLELMQNRYGQDKINYETVKSNVEDIDMAETLMQFQMTESVYTAALSIGSRIIQPSLVDFLR